MTDLGDTAAEPLKSWDCWPHNYLQKGDIIRVCWSYDGVHGPCWSEDIYLLMGRETKEKSETWHVTQLYEDRNGMKNHKINFKQLWIASEDFEHGAPGDWQRISLLARAEDDDC